MPAARDMIQHILKHADWHLHGPEAINGETRHRKKWPTVDSEGGISGHHSIPQWGLKAEGGGWEETRMGVP